MSNIDIDDLEIDVVNPDKKDKPLSSIYGSYDPEAASVNYQRNKELIQGRYHYQKFISKRRDTGAIKLNKLKPEHMQYVSCFINGMKGVEIAEQFNIDAHTVYRVLADPLARGLIAEFDERFKDEFNAMFPLVSDAIREGLEDKTLNNRLKAVDRWTKVSRFLTGQEEDGGNATKGTELVIAARVRLTSLIKDATKELADALPDGGIIEGEIIATETSK